MTNFKFTEIAEMINNNQIDYKPHGTMGRHHMQFGFIDGSNDNEIFVNGFKSDGSDNVIRVLSHQEFMYSKGEVILLKDLKDIKCPKKRMSRMTGIPSHNISFGKEIYKDTSTVRIYTDGLNCSHMPCKMRKVVEGEKRFTSYNYVIEFQDRTGIGRDYYFVNKVILGRNYNEFTTAKAIIKLKYAHCEDVIKGEIENVENHLRYEKYHKRNQLRTTKKGLA